MLADSAERQMAAGSAFIGTPADIVEMLRAFNDKVGGIDSVSLHFTPGDMKRTNTSGRFAISSEFAISNRMV